MTPGSLCESSRQVRYPERIKYCSRDVDSSTKRQVIREYNERLGYDIQPGDRHEFKIDHLIPLCAGGSNQKSNLWPQHETVYVITDDLEQLICVKMAQGVLLQARAIELLMRAKMHLDEADDVRDILEAL